MSALKTLILGMVAVKRLNLPLKNAIAVFVTTDGLPYQQGCLQETRFNQRKSTSNLPWKQDSDGETRDKGAHEELITPAFWN